MSEIQISKSQREWLASQLDCWKSRELLSADQVASVLGVYATQAQLADRNRSRLMMALMGVAALLMGLGALLLVGYNWGAMPSGLKLIIIFSVIVGTQALGLFLRFKRSSKLLSEVVFFFACFLYGIGIFLVAQIFNLNAHYPDGVWWWALGVLPIALCMDTLLLHLLLVSLLGFWCGMEALYTPSVGRWFVSWEPVSCVTCSLPLFVLPGIVWGYRKKSLVAVALYVMLFSWWVVLQPIEWQWGAEGLLFIGMIGGWMLVISESHYPGDRFAIPFRLFGVLLTASVLLVLSTYWVNNPSSRSEPAIANFAIALASFVLSLATVVVAMLIRQSKSNASLDLIEETKKNARRQSLPLGVILLLAVLLCYRVIQEPLFPTIAANVAVFLLAIWLIALGLREDRALPFSAGVLYFLLWAVIRYVDLFGDLGGMLGASLMFFLCGGVLFGVAWYWNHRGRIQHV